ncbi:ABC transporter ATP-binding protein [Micromonospora sp. NPDC048830]|uniref:ABC transporter ATP-binding protein n=1 Tax=Micromonospora sp. NPDC048830 TaxID=3364257 RepID=UPI00372157D7
MIDPASVDNRRATPCVELVGIHKTYPGVVANNDVSLQIFEGEVLALLGENGAGKSTLMKIVGGVVSADAGSIHVRGREVRIRRPRDAQSLGIGMVHQHFMLVPDMTVAENVALSIPGKLAASSQLDQVRDRIRELAESYQFGVDPDALVEDLSVGERQRVEILKLLYTDTGILIFDEPTAVLTKGEWQHLSKVLRSMADVGRTVVLITHKLDEVFDVADRCTVLRDGRLIGTVATRETTPAEVINMMVGREVRLRQDRAPAALGAPALTFTDVCVNDRDGRPRLEDVSLEVRDGEILGIAGIEGNGQSYLVDLACGVRAADSGSVVFAGHEVGHPTPADLAARGVAVIPEDRHRNAVALTLSVSENLLVKELNNPSLFRRGLRRRRAIHERDEKLVAEYDIRVPNADVRMRQLSGGNQQKAVIARELSRQPRLVIAAQPTRGLDVGAMEYVYRALNAHRARGGATLLVSSEMEELLMLSDRIAVLVRGRIVAVLDAAEATVERLGHLMISHPNEVPA